MSGYVLVAFGGALGSVCRYFISRQFATKIVSTFPWGILLCNVLGCFLMGCVVGFFASRAGYASIWRPGVCIGFLGGFTTFSSFGLDTLMLGQQSAWHLAVLNILLTVVFSLLATVAGFYLAR